jgi:anthraniloyl-CoA monooxygenase
MLLEHARELLSGGADVLVLEGEPSRLALLDRLAVGERVRAELGAVVSVTSTADNLKDVADGLLADRTDLVTISDQR